MSKNALNREDILDQAIEQRKGEELNVDKLTAYLHDNLEGFKNLVTIKQYPSGYSNLTYLIKTMDKDYVLRRPPFGASVETAHDMYREYKVLSTLGQVYNKIPHVYLYCDDTDVLGAPFYVMERIEGVILRGQLPEGVAHSDEWLLRLSENAITNLADLHKLNLKTTGLGKLGKPEGYVQRQVEGWTKRYYNAETDKLDVMDLLAEWMQENRPKVEQEPAFIHNDYKFDNLVLNPDNLSEIIAVLDWEMSTVGDPLMDLGTTLGYWAEPNDHPALKKFSLTSAPGVFDREQVVKHYASLTGREVGNIIFYYVFGCFKIGVIAQQIYKRFKEGHTNDKRFAGLIYVVEEIAKNGQRAIENGRIGNFY